jgi:type I pantothenate kinase
MTEAEMIDVSAELVWRTQARAHPGATTLVAVTGPVAVGKSTMCEQLMTALDAVGSSAAVVSTDGFLYPYAELQARGLMMRKGFPESYDVAALEQFVAGARARAADLSAPIYSHDTYDLVPDQRQHVGVVDVIVIEGVNALSATAGLVDLGVYLHAEEVVIERWYIERFRRLCEEATPGSFYAQFSSLDAAQIDSVAQHVWDTINLVNLRDHIAPSRVFADVIVEKLPDHRVGAVVDVAKR